MELRVRELELLRTYGKEWGAVGGGFHIALHRFKRGFPVPLQISAQDFANQGDRILLRAPTDDLTINEVPAGIDALARAPHLRWIHHLRLVGGGVDATVLSKLLGSPHLAQLETLALDFQPVGTKGMAVLVDCPALSSLRELSLWKAELGDEAIHQLERSVFRASLEALNLAENGLTSACVGSLETRDFLGQRVLLSLAHNPFGDEGISRLCAAGRLRIESLDLSSTCLTADATRALSASPALQFLKSLTLSGNVLGDEGAQWLGQSEHLLHLRELDVRRCAIGDAGFKALGSSRFTPNLEFLNLAENRLTDVSVDTILQTPSLLRLLARFVAGWGEDPVGISDVSDRSSPAFLLGQNSISAAGEQRLLEGTRFGNICA